LHGSGTAVQRAPPSVVRHSACFVGPVCTIAVPVRASVKPTHAVSSGVRGVAGRVHVRPPSVVRRSGDRAPLRARTAVVAEVGARIDEFTGGGVFSGRNRVPPSVWLHVLAIIPVRHTVEMTRVY